MATVDQTFGRRLDQEMQRRGISVLRLADEIGKAPVTIERWITGGTSPRLDDAAKAATVLNVSLDYLAGRGEAA